MSVILIQEHYFLESSAVEFLTVENFSEPMVEPSFHVLQLGYHKATIV